MKIKIFIESYGNDLEKKVNDWISDWENKYKIIDISHVANQTKVIVLIKYIPNDN